MALSFLSVASSVVLLLFFSPCLYSQLVMPDYCCCSCCWMNATAISLMSSTEPKSAGCQLPISPSMRRRRSTLLSWCPSLFLSSSFSLSRLLVVKEWERTKEKHPSTQHRRLRYANAYRSQRRSCWLLKRWKGMNSWPFNKNTYSILRSAVRSTIVCYDTIGPSRIIIDALLFRNIDLFLAFNTTAHLGHHSWLFYFSLFSLVLQVIFLINREF